MIAAPAAGFDSLAPEYEKLWSGTKAGQLQREAVWRRAMPLLSAGNSVLDLGCGTGDDALMLAGRGVRVTGIDASAEMVRIAFGRGVDARCCSIENLDGLQDTFDAVWSNFGALNCVENLADLREPFLRLVKPGGCLIVCLMSRICLREAAWYSLHGDLRKAARRWGGEASSSIKARVFYPTVRAVRRAFAPDFHLVGAHGIGVAVPPSYVTGISDAAMHRLDAFDKCAASLPILRALGDHRLLIFRSGPHK